MHFAFRTVAARTVFRRLFTLLLAGFAAAANVAIAQDAVTEELTQTTTVQKADAATSEAQQKKAVEELAETIRKSVVVVRATGRDGREYGHGTGFVISEDGLIATARHVIGDRRAIRVELPDGTQVPVTHIHAATEAVDLVVLKVASKDLSPLPLAREAKVKTGQSVVTVGYPRNTSYSFFSGSIAGEQEIDGIQMLKLAMNIESGSSGEPIVDLSGNVLGIVTLKSTEIAGVGFAVPVDHLQQLLVDPVPMPMSRWMQIGALDAKQWEVLWGANWRQRASRILVDGYGESFGGRSLCLRSATPPETPFEIQVDVKLDNESGAAGLAFHADGGDRHYGFYPSAGKIRLTRFDGPELNSWTILHNELHPSYRPGDWNSLKVRIEQDRVLCYVNGELAVESTDDVIPPGRIGLATFRGTSAAFRRFQSGGTIPSTIPGDEQAAEIAEILKRVTAVRPAAASVVSELRPLSRYAPAALAREAERLEQKARYTRQLATEVHAAVVRDQILRAMGRSVGRDDAATESTQPDLLKAALLIAVLDNPEIEAQSYIDRVDQLANEIREALPNDTTETERLAALDKLLFEEYGFRGSRYEYYTRSNSYLNEVIDDREGLPITLSVLYIELARRLDLKVVGLGVPGHYVVRYEPTDEAAAPQIIDVFNHGKRLTNEDIRTLVKQRGLTMEPAYTEAQSIDDIVTRMLVNLLSLAESSRDDERVLRYLETLVAIDPENADLRARRPEIRARTERLTESLEDVDWFLAEQPAGTNLEGLRQLKQQLQDAAEQQAAE